VANNFIYVGVSRGPIRNFYLGKVASGIEYQGKEIPNLDRDFRREPLDLTPYIPAGSETKVTIYAMDYGDEAFASDLFLVFTLFPSLVEENSHLRRPEIRVSRQRHAQLSGSLAVGDQQASGLSPQPYGSGRR